MKGLRGATTVELRTLRAAVAGDELATPVTSSGLTAYGGLGSVVACIDTLAGLDQATLLEPRGYVSKFNLTQTKTREYVSELLAEDGQSRKVRHPPPPGGTRPPVARVPEGSGGPDEGARPAPARPRARWRLTGTICGTKLSP